MNSKNIVALENEDKYCWKCLKQLNRNDIHRIKIPASGYGSNFDNFSTELQLCDSCYKETNPEWWKFESLPFCESGGELFKYDNEIYEYLNNLPLQGQELVWSRYAYGAFTAGYMEAQDWIDYELDELTHKDCQKYNLYSPQVIAAYKERFSTCQYKVNVNYSDGSSGYCCPFGSSENGTSENCYDCEAYIKRNIPIVSIDNEDWEEFVIFIAYHTQKKYLEEKFAGLGLVK